MSVGVRQYRFVLTGASALLMHQDNIEGGELVREWQKDPANKGVSVPGDDRSPGWAWMTYLYHDGSHVAMPAANISVALRQAGSRMILQRQKTFKEISQSGMCIDTEYCKFTCNGEQIPVGKIDKLRDKPFKDQADGFRSIIPQGKSASPLLQLYVKRATIGRAKHVRVRPRFNAWTVEGTVTVYAQELTTDVLQKMFGISGQVGLGDWRPGCKTPGPYGRFTAVVEEL